MPKGSSEWLELHRETTKRLASLAYMQENLLSIRLDMPDTTLFMVSPTSAVIPNSLLESNKQRAWAAEGREIFLIDEAPNYSCFNILYRTCQDKTPFCVYYTLESISCLAANCEDKRISVMSTALRRMLRASVNDKRDIITLREDISIAKEYLNIQNIRYCDQLHTEFCVDESLDSVPIPALTLQPLVENAVRHGAEQMLDVCEIRVTAFRQGTYVDIAAEDNGPEMSEDTLEKLESGEIQPEGLGIGLRNIHQRLRLAFGDQECGLRIQCRNGKTQVIVRTIAGGKENEIITRR